MPLPLVALFLLAASMHASAQQLDVRVLLERITNEVGVQVAEGHRGFAGERLLFETPLGITWPVAAAADRLVVDGITLEDSFTLAPRSGKITWRERQYRGALRFVAQGDELLVINVVGLEEYLRGVVPAEVMPAWPLESLKAQAVASRTYTLVSLDPAGSYDICATIECQVYDGIADEHLRTDRAVAETAGMVLTFDGEFARTYYHSDSGGALASSAEVWGTAVPYLATRSDVASSTPHRQWQLALDPHRMAGLLAELGHSVGAVRALHVTSYSESGRARRAQVVGSNGALSLSGAALTSLLRASGLKSTRFTMVGNLVARGDGWGHGVGMSQYGARSLASSGYSFDRILHFYYPQTQLQRLANTCADGAANSAPRCEHQDTFTDGPANSTPPEE